jgi:serine/threonine protein kinase
LQVRSKVLKKNQVHTGNMQPVFVGSETFTLNETCLALSSSLIYSFLFCRYYQTGRLTESSDVYSFGIVLLEVVTGEPPIMRGQGFISQRVKNRIATGDINLVADARLQGDYDVSSMWKVVNTAILCTSDDAVQRPTMTAVVLQLKESLALEEARGDHRYGQGKPRE